MIRCSLAKVLAYPGEYFLKQALVKACPTRIPRSGEKGAQVNCYVITIDREGGPYLLVNSLSAGCLFCSEWDGKSYSQERSILLNDVDPEDFRITHYCGLYDVRYFGLADFVRGQFFNIPYLKIHGHRFLSELDQYFFNKRKLVTKQRMELLRLLIDQTLDGESQIEIIDLMIKLYSDRWLLHPEGDAQLEKVKLYLASLEATGDLHKVIDRYVVAGQALRTLEEYEEQERKHGEQIKLQRGALVLTFVIVFLTLVQAGLVKLPALIDFSRVGQPFVVGR